MAPETISDPHSPNYFPKNAEIFLPFSLSFFHQYTKDFSRSCVTPDNFITLVANGVCAIFMCMNAYVLKFFKYTDYQQIYPT